MKGTQLSLAKAITSLVCLHATLGLGSESSPTSSANPPWKAIEGLLETWSCFITTVIKVKNFMGL